MQLCNTTPQRSFCVKRLTCCMPLLDLHAGLCAVAVCCCHEQVVCEGRLYSRWLTRQLQAAGAHFVQRKLTSLAELAGEGWDVVVNCSGLGARQLLPDRNSYPIRGQIMRVRAPWVNQCVFAHFPDETSYIIPNRWGVRGGAGAASGSRTYNIGRSARQVAFFLGSL